MICVLGAGGFAGALSAGTGSLIAPALGVAPVGGAIFAGVFTASITPALAIGLFEAACNGSSHHQRTTADIIWAVASLFAAIVLAPAATLLAGYTLTVSAALIIGAVGVICILATLVLGLVVICCNNRGGCCS